MIRRIKISRRKGGVGGEIKPNFKKGKRRMWGAIGISLAVVFGMVMEQIPLEAMVRHMKDKKVMGVYQGQINCPYNEHRFSTKSSTVAKWTGRVQWMLFILTLGKHLIQSFTSFL